MATRFANSSTVPGDRRIMTTETQLADFLVSYRPKLVNQAHKILGNRDVAEDLASETVLRMIGLFRANGLQNCHQAAVAACGHRILHNMAIDFLRQPAQRCTGLADQASNVCPRAERAFRQAEAAIVCHQLLAHLPDHESAAVSLFNLEDCSAKIGAERLRISLPAFRSRLCRGRNRARSVLQKLSDISAAT